MYKRTYTRIDTLRKYVDEMLLKNENANDRRCGYVHLYGVGMSAAIIALNRGHSTDYAELAEMAGMLHDYISYQGMDGENHAHEGEPIVRELLNIINITTQEETDMICSAVYNHSDKDKIDSEFDEIIKDADVMQHWLRNPKEPLWRELDRVEKLCKEFGFNILD
jgi:HD superfamily phosphodiesterase